MRILKVIRSLLDNGNGGVKFGGFINTYNVPTEFDRFMKEFDCP